MFGEIVIKSGPLKPDHLIPKPSERSKDWAPYLSLMAFVFIDDQRQVRIQIGQVGGDPVVRRSKKTAADQRITVVCQFRIPEFEKVFDLKDPCLLRRDEIGPLKDQKNTIEWFKDVFPPETCEEIAKLLSKPDFGIGEAMGAPKVWKTLDDLERFPEENFEQVPGPRLELAAEAVAEQKKEPEPEKLDSVSEPRNLPELEE